MTTSHALYSIYICNKHLYNNFFEVAVAQVLGRDKPVLFLSSSGQVLLRTALPI